MKKSLRLRIVKVLIPCFSLLLSVFSETHAQVCVPPVAKPNGVANIKICDPISTYDLPDAKTGTEAETWTVITSPADPVATITSAGIVSGMITNGLYKFVLTSNSTGCTDTVSITRNPIPMSGANQDICSPLKTAKLVAASTGQTWSVVTQPSGANSAVDANGNVTNLTVNGVYTFRITEGTCFDEVQINRKAQPIAGDGFTICSPQTTATLFIPQNNDLWSVVTSPANPSPATIVAAFGDISGMVNIGTYQFVLTSAGCTDTVQVKKITGITLSVTNPVSTCIGGNFTITTTSDAGTGAIYSWVGPNGFTSSQKDATLANLVSASMGIYTLNVTSTTGCSATATSQVKLSQISVAALSGKLNYCVGEIIKLGTLNPEVGYTYDWSGPGGFTSMNTLSITRQTTPDKAQAGDYSIKITSPNGCFAITTFNVTVTECLSIGNIVWNDVNNDGLLNNAETGVGNVPVKLYKSQVNTAGFPLDIPDGAAIQTTTTNASTGKYLFSGLIPGYYIVEIDAPNGYKSSTGTNASLTGIYEPSMKANTDENDSDDGTKFSGQIIRTLAVELGNYTEPTFDGDVTNNTDADKNSNLTIDFGIYKPASIGDFVWLDTDKDGVQDTGELGVSGITVKLYAGNSTTALATTTTDGNGKYLFDNLTPGTYTVEFVKTSIGAGNIFSPLNGVGSTPATDSNADPSTGKSLPVTLIAGEFNQTIDAGISGDCPGSTVGTITVPSLCAGSTLTMQATSSDPLATYSWTSTNAFTATTQSITIPNITTANAGTYTVLITNSNLCTSALTANVVVNPLPTLANVSGSMVCEGSTATLSASGATTYSWVGPNNFTSTLSNPTIPNATAVNAGVYTVTGATNGCTAIGLATLMIDKKPVPTATGAAICLGGSGTISVLPTGLKFYAWVSPNAFTSSQQTASILNATASNAGTYTVLVTDAKGCTATATAAVTVGSALTVTPTSNSPVCAGTRLELGANGGTGATYLWTSPTGVTSNLPNPFTNTATSADNGTWTVAVTNADGCKGTGSANVVINPALTGVTATASAPACSGGNISLTSIPAGAKTYEWTSTGATAFTSTVQNPTFTSPSVSVYTFTVKVTDNNGCTALATASTTIFATPTATASSNTPVCFGSTIQLTGSTNGTKFAWTGPNNFNSSLQSPTIANANASNSGTYTFVVSNANSCNATATTTVVVNAKLSGGNDLSICTPVSTAQLTLVSGATWAAEPTNPTVTAINNNSATVSGLSSVGTYIFYLTNTSGCKDTVKVYVNSKLDAGDDKVICSPKSTISLLSLNGGQTWRYFANGSSLPTPTVTANNVTGMTQDGKYYFILEQSGNEYCADTIIVERKPSPNAGIDQTTATGGGICETETTAQLQAATTGQTWSVAANSVGFGTVAIDQAGKATKLFKIGKYLFVLTQGECTDTVAVERKARSSAGADMTICESETSATLTTATTGETWSAMPSNPSTVVFGANGSVTGLTAIGVYEFVLTSANGCTDTTKVTRIAGPIFSVTALQATCSIGAANPDAKLSITGLDLANKFDYSEGTSYTGTKTFATASAITATTMTVSGLANPTADKSYTVRVFSANGCYTDKTVVLKTRVCECEPDVCLPYSFRKTK